MQLGFRRVHLLAAHELHLPRAFIHAHSVSTARHRELTFLFEPNHPRVHARLVVIDGNIITSRGAGTAIEFAAAVVKRLAGENAARDILARIQYQR